MQFKKFQNISEFAVGGGGGVSKLQTKSEVLGFFCLLNPSLIILSDEIWKSIPVSTCSQGKVLFSQLNSLLSYSNEHIFSVDVQLFEVSHYESFST